MFFFPLLFSFSGNMTQLKAIAMILLIYLMKHDDNAIYFVCVFYSSPTQTKCHSFCGSNYDPAFSGLHLPLNLNLSLTVRQVSTTGQKAHWLRFEMGTCFMFINLIKNVFVSQIFTFLAVALVLQNKIHPVMANETGLPFIYFIQTARFTIELISWTRHQRAYKQIVEKCIAESIFTSMNYRFSFVLSIS